MPLSGPEKSSFFDKQKSLFFNADSEEGLAPSNSALILTIRGA